MRRLTPVLLALALGACMAAPFQAASPSSPTTRLSRFASASGQKDFFWGVSTAGYQWEGGDTTSQWAKWVAAGKTEDRNDRAVDGWNRVGEDAGLARGLGCNAFRTSIEWARIEPREGEYDPAAVAHYHQMLRTLRAQGLEPIVTLMHFSYPAWLDADGGWQNPKAIARFEKYARFVAQEFGADVDWYLTFNEPNVFVLASYVVGAHPPGLKSPVAAYKVARNMIAAHKAAYRAVHEADAVASVGSNMYVANYTLVEEAPEAKASEDDFMAELTKGDAKGRTLDFAALDYYCRLPVFQMIGAGGIPRPDRWKVDPAGFTSALLKYDRKYHLPILIAENGMATHDHAEREDGWTRSAYMVAHVAAMESAVDQGARILGYVHWSITDNFEWGSFSPCFGLYRVDARTPDLSRREGDGVAAYRRIIKANGITVDLLKDYPPPSF